MTFIPKRLYSGSVGTGAPSSPWSYTAPSVTTALIRCLVAVNNNAAPVHLTAWLVPSGGTANAASLLLPTIALPANTAGTVFDAALVLNTGDALAFQADSSGVTVHVCGAEES